ncbi:hypothetical protein [Pseudarthrobacter sulfonivorans]|uniref:hypothetical protein n=1 Tax=Pseudarthrobacter sulfonivorans TaxID=121292 RepID=UPI002106A2E4|nr:hypothetical protein [Pseudarthrobacter sulfonivorans]
MRTFHRILAGAGVLLATALPASAALAAPAQLERVGFRIEYLTGCTDDPELVVINGRYHLLTLTKADGSVAYHLSIKSSGVGDDGIVYIVNENASDRINADGTEIVLDQFRVISKGSSQNVLQFVGFTISPSGVLTLTTDRSVCVG